MMRKDASGKRLLLLLSVCVLAGLVCWWRSPATVRVRLLRPGEFEVGHNSFYDKDEDTGRTLLTGHAYRCGLFVVFVTRRWEK